MNEKGLISEALLLLVAFFLMVSLIIFASSIRLSSLGVGKHTGYVTAVDQRGWVFRNYEVYFKTDNSSSQEDTYCVHRDNIELAEKLKQYSLERKLVNITYKGVRAIGFGLCHYAQIIEVKVD